MSDSEEFENEVAQPTHGNDRPEGGSRLPIVFKTMAVLAGLHAVIGIPVGVLVSQDSLLLAFGVYLAITAMIALAFASWTIGSTIDEVRSNV